MANKLKDDNISLNLNVGTDKTQENIRKLGDETAKLKQRNDQLLESMAKLDAQGKENSKTYARYADEVDRNNAKLEKNSGEVKRLTDSLDINNRSMKQLRTEAKQLSSIMDKLNPNSAEWKKANEQYREVNARMKEIKSATYDTKGGFTSMAASASKYGSLIVGAFTAAYAALKSFGALFKGLTNSTQTTGDALRATLGGIKSQYDELMRTIATGDWSNFIDRMKEAYEVGKEVTKILDEQFERMNSYEITDAKVKNDIEILYETLNDTNESLEKQIEAGKKIQELTREQRGTLQDITDERLKASTKALEFATKMNEKEREFFIENYNQNYELISQATTLLELEEKERKFRSDYSWEQTPENLKKWTEVQSDIKKTTKDIKKMTLAYIKSGKEDVNVVEVLRKYNRGNDSLIKPFVEALTASLNVFNQSEKELRRVNKRMNTLKKQQTDQEKKDGEDATKAAKEAEANRLKDIETQLENEHQARLTILKQMRKGLNETEAQYNEQLTVEEQASIDERIEAYENFLKTVKDSKLRKEVEKKLAAERSKQLDAERSYDQAQLALVQASFDEQQDTITRSYDEQKAQLDKDLAQKQITQEQYNLKMIQLDAETSAKRMLVDKQLLEEINELELKNGDIKAKAVADANDKVLKADVKATQDRAALITKIVEGTADFRKQLSLLSLEEEKNAELEVLKRAYQAQLDLLEEHEQNTLELTKAYEQAKANIEFKANQQKFAQRKQLGLTGWKEEYDMEIENLQNLLDNKKISEEEYNKAVFNARVGYLKQYVDYYSNLFSGAITALQDAEIANVEAKYDAEIAAAGDNTQEVEKLEQEKAQKTLDVQKKYADVNFAIKAAQIIADTSVAIMQGFAQLGPIGGAIAAVLMAVTGVAQLAAANAERKKVKAMTLNGGSSDGAGQRVVSTGGFSEGGYTGDGTRLEPAGIVHRGEYVVPAPELRTPTVMNHVRAIEQLRRKRTHANTLPGYAEGGYTGNPSGTSPNSAAQDPELKLMLSLNSQLLKQLIEQGVYASVSLSDFDRQQQLLQQSQSLGTR